MQMWPQQKTTTGLRRHRPGFTIVELLIVVVVIAILAAISIIAYNGISKRAVRSSVQSALSQVNKKVLLYHAEQGVYPATLGDIGIADQSGSPFYNYVSDNAATPAWYQLTVSDGVNGTERYSVSSTDLSMQAGVAAGSNIAPWDKNDNTTAPVLASAGITFDTSVYRTSTASIRFSPGAPGKTIRINPVTGSVGQVVRVGLWIKTDPVWNGTPGGSKVRIATHPAGSLLLGCPYDGVKTTWTYVTCSYTLNAANTSIAVQLANDGSVGNIWIDDFSVSVR